MKAHGFRTVFLIVSCCCALPAMAQDSVGISVAPFGSSGSPADLSQEIELELELDEGLVVLPYSEIKAALGRTRLENASDKRIFRAMRKAGAKVLIRGLADEEEKKLLILMYNAPDRSIILAKTVSIAEHLGRASALAQTLADTARDYDVIDEIPASDIASAKQELSGRRIAGGQDADEGEQDPADETDRMSTDREDAAVDEEPRQSTSQQQAPSASSPSPTDEQSQPTGRLEQIDEEQDKEGKTSDEVYLFDRVARVTLRYAPPMMSYSSCQPAAGPTPFFCQSDIPAQGASLVPWLTPASLGFSLELTPWVRWVGFQMDGSVYRTVLPLSPAGAWFTGSDSNPDSLLASGPDAIEVRGGDFNMFGSAQGAFAFGLIGVSIGGRLGVMMNVALTEEHVVAAQDEGGNTVTYPITVLPSFFSINPAIGAHGAVFIGRWVRLSANLDVTPVGYQLEFPTSVGSTTLTLATHGKLQVDVDPIFGIILSAFVDGTAISVRGQGPGTRIHRGLERFANGQADLFVLKSGLGVGYHF